MIWILAILLALAAFAVAVFLFRLERATWSSLLAALAFGLAGYALQASPDIEGAPKSARGGESGDQWQVVDTRKQLVSIDHASANELVLVSDAFARRGQYEDAAAFLSRAVQDNPRDFEAWLALGNALTEQADGILTQAAVFAYSRAAELAPQSPAPGYFLGLSLIRQGRLMEARQVWRSAIEAADPESPATQFAAERLERLEAMLNQARAMADPNAQE